ncbi:hypothetical protein L249_1797 [Ophiocordyceps polyrhachis-furcata BCC 54312]|uniref:MARVEL domain-containing protein n=1 Tax=Ophiocordyceps polyrhachis-furcata BCC 54312 TaxID=1330021 RepID=A0A367LRM7_9HYPO|nr:hypothetical protein L249_1797 [Ophiocordyceps polyrhachis-furcata BCC 54312]
MQAHTVLSTMLHVACFICSIIACGLYAKDLPAQHGPNSKWVYAVVVSVLSAVTCLLYAAPKVLRKLDLPAASWSLVLFILWIAVFGVFGSMYIKMGDDDKTNHGNSNDVRRMKAAVWIDLVNALLWLISAVSLFAYWLIYGDRRTRFTGRAYV